MLNQLLGQYLKPEILIALIVSVWSLVWKGLALWQAARVHKKWFMAILVLNTLGILDIVYLLFFAPKPYFKKLNLESWRQKLPF